MRMYSETQRLKLGFMPLTDCAPIAVAQECGFFERENLNVDLSRENSWAQIRDKVALGELDGAQMLAPMVIAASLGLEPIAEPFVTGLSLNLNGNAITVSAGLYDEMAEADPRALQVQPLTAHALKAVIRKRLLDGRQPLTLAMVFPFSSHNYELRYWLAAVGIHPDRDIRLVVVPPPQVVSQLRVGAIDGYCVGEPWNNAAVAAELGRTLVTSHELWSNGPEKVFGVREEWAAAHPEQHQALLRALIRACRRIDTQEGRYEAADILSRPEYIGISQEQIIPSLTGASRQTAGDAVVNMPDFNVFHRYAANFPWLSHASWFISQMYRWGQIDRAIDIRAAAARAYRPDLYRRAAQEVGADYPLIDEKKEGANTYAWALEEATRPIGFAPDRFIDGRVFEPSDPIGYLEQFHRHSLRVSLESLRRANGQEALQTSLAL